MYKILITLSLMFFLYGCSSYSLSSSMWKSAAVGAMGGATMDYALKPEGKKYEPQNVVGSALIGAGVGALAGYLFHKDDPAKNPVPRKKEDYEIKEEMNSIQKDSEKPEYQMNLGKNKIFMKLKFDRGKSYKQNVENLPKDLKGLFPTPTVDVHKLEPQIFNNGKESMVMRGCELSIQTVSDPVVNK